MKKNKYIANLTMVLILLICSIGIYMTYPFINENVKNRNKESHISQYMASQIFYSNYAISQELDKKANISTSLESYITVADNSESKRIKNHFTSLVLEYQSNLWTQNDFSFEAKNNKTGETLSNTKDSLLNIYSQNDLQDQYQWYVTIHYSSEGIITYQSHLNDQERFESQFDSMISYYYNDQQEYNYETEEDVHIKSDLSTLNDLTITYAISQNILPTSDLAQYLLNDSVGDYLRFELPYVLGLCLLIIIITLIIPIQYLNHIKIFGIIAKIKFIFLSFLWCVSVGTLFYISPFLIHANYSGNLIKAYKLFGIDIFSGFLTPFLHLSFWFIFFALITIFAYMIKYLFNKGAKAYFMENTCLGWIFLNSRKLINTVIDFDLNDNINRSVLKIVIVNFIIITVISWIWVFGIFAALIYSIIIFYLLKNKFVDIKKDYEVLLNATQRLSNGHFDVDIHEDVGIFNPLKNEFSHIKDGFEKAVKEEVKSQKMKTELISNVSHDLKTPLTSIITYVDLLKKDPLSDEERNQYIHVLERNSLRLKNLIDDLFEVSKANSGDIKLNMMDIDIVSLIKQAELECQDKLDEKSLDIKITTPDEKIIHSLDSSKTYRIFENLFINISKYALEHTRVYIDVINDDNKISIVFKNISKQEINFNSKEIVERFVQGDKSRNTTGSGLGLAIVKSFTELQKGQFLVETDGDLFKSIIIFYK